VFDREEMKYIRIIPFLCGVALIQFHCGYLGMIVNKWELKREQYFSPTQKTKLEIETESCHTIYGYIRSIGSIKKNVAVAALSYRFGKQEIVATSFLCHEGIFSLLLPPGEYQLFAFSDDDKNAIFDANECCGTYNEGKFINLPEPTNEIRGGYDIHLSRVFTIDKKISIQLPPTFKNSMSNYYPPGSIRSLDDTLFSDDIVKKGIYSPAEFHSISGNYFYALRERDEKKIPILFVHGYGGSPRDFRYLISQIDSTKYDFWFFYYPSGQRLNFSSSALYEIFFSGKISKNKNNKMIIIAHSMGGLVARQALNAYCKSDRHDIMVKYLSMCTPYGGDDQAKNGLRQAPEIISSWKDVANESDFLTSIYRSPLSKKVSFYLFFGFKDESIVKKDENSDGTIILRSQLFPAIQKEAIIVRGFNETHVSILNSKDVADNISELIE
jgi:pimeloyl-ACP methyl ester carboxylesterase